MPQLRPWIGISCFFLSIFPLFSSMCNSSLSQLPSLGSTGSIASFSAGWQLGKDAGRFWLSCGRRLRAVRLSQAVSHCWCPCRTLPLVSEVSPGAHTSQPAAVGMLRCYCSYGSNYGITAVELSWWGEALTGMNPTNLREFCLD